LCVGRTSKKGQEKSEKQGFEKSYLIAVVTKLSDLHFFYSSKSYTNQRKADKKYEIDKIQIKEYDKTKRKAKSKANCDKDNPLSNKQRKPQNKIKNIKKAKHAERGGKKANHIQ